MRCLPVHCWYRRDYGVLCPAGRCFADEYDKAFEEIAMTTFQVGDVVRLKSGGPAMTVQAAGRHHPGETLIDVHWFDGDQLSRDSFGSETQVKSGDTLKTTKAHLEKDRPEKSVDQFEDDGTGRCKVCGKPPGSDYEATDRLVDAAEGRVLGEGAEGPQPTMDPICRMKEWQSLRDMVGPMKAHAITDLIARMIKRA